MDEINPGTTTIPCPHCRQPIDTLAKKCHHCGESLVTPSLLQRFSKRLAAFVGICTALLSLFFALKEGYFFIEQRQQERELFGAYMNAAQNFTKLDNLEYAEASLNQALALNPGDAQLRLRLFLLRARNLLRDADYYAAQLPDDKLDALPGLITDGFSLLEYGLAPQQRATLLLSLARLMEYDRHWQNPAAIGELYADALALDGANAETAFWYGEWFLAQTGREDEGLALIANAAARDGENPLYLEALGRHQARRGEYAAAFASLSRAIELAPRQHDLQRIRAANEAKYSLRRALTDADQHSPIDGAEFFGLNLDERVAITGFALQQAGADRSLRLLGARLFHRSGEQARAEALLRELLGDYDQRSDGAMLELFAAVLEANGQNDEAARVRALLEAKQERESYEEILEAGLEGGHRYKIGLRLKKQDDGTGIEVLTAYSAYPFAKAGVQRGDRLLEFAHRPVTSLRSIWVPALDFAPGTDVPLKLRRGDEVLELSVVIE